MKWKTWLAALASTVALGLVWTLAPKASADSNDLTTWTFTPVDVPLPNVTQTYVRDMNPAGQIVGHYTQTGVGTRGFVLSDGVFTTGIAARVTGGTQLRGINPQGDIVGTVWGGGQPWRAFLLRQGVITEFGYPGASYTIAEDIDATGDIVGYYGLSGVNHGFVYRDGVLTTIDVPGALWTTVRGINPEGEIVGVYQAVDPDGVPRGHGFLRGKDGSFTTIDGPGVPPNGNANGINPRGEIVGEYNAVPGVPPRLGFLLSGGSYMTIMYPGANITRPFKITPDGQHIVGFYDDLHGFVLSRKALK